MEPQAGRHVSGATPSSFTPPPTEAMTARTSRSLPTGRLSLLAGLLALLASCGGSSDPAELVSAGEKSLGTREFSAAAESFDAALAAIGGDASHPYYLRAKLGAIEARCDSDAKGASDDLIALSREMPGKVTDGDFNRIANLMGSAKQFDAAIAVLAEGKTAYPESAHLDKLGEQLRKQAEASGDSSALDALAGLGYVGE